MYEETRPRLRGYLLYINITMAVSVVLLLFSRHLPGFGEWYARHVFPIFPYSLGRLASFAPFSLFEWVTLGLLASLPIALLWKTFSPALRRNRWQDEPPRKPLSRRVLRLFCLGSSMFLLFVLTCGVNYNRETFAQQSGLGIEEMSAGDLRQLYRFLASEIDALPTAGNAASAPFPAMDRVALHETAITAMDGLSRSYPGLINYYPEPKPVFLSELLSRCQLGGFFSCFTMEANYNRHMPALNMPFTICHELAHISGFAREDEANFVGYLACSQSGDAGFRYSGISYALRYTLHALRQSVESEEYLRLCEYLPEWVWQDLWENRLYWQTFEGKASAVYQAANDTFLKMNNQEDGMQSYGRMLFLLLAYHRDSGRLAHFSSSPEPVLAEIAVSAKELHSPYAILADRETGAVLFAKDSAVRAEPASVTKVLTAVTAIELIEDMNATVTMKTQDFTDLYKRSASLSGFKVGETVTYRDLLYTLMLISGCDSAYALANNLCGSLPAFAAKMNEKAAGLGLSDSHFADPSGLTAPEHYSSAENTVKILDYALQNTVFREIIETKNYIIPPTNLTPEEREITNFFFSRLDQDYEGGYLENGARLLGGKTGFTNAAGLCLATVGVFEGREYIAVIFGGPGTNRTPQYNFLDAMTLFGALKNRQFAMNVF